MEKPLTVGKVTIESASQRALDGSTLSGERSTGTATLFDLTGPPGVAMQIADVRWANGERDLRVVSCQGPKQLLRLEHGLRLGVHRHRPRNGLWTWRKHGST
jgi:hypothetical protein